MRRGQDALALWVYSWVCLSRLPNWVETKKRAIQESELCCSAQLMRLLPFLALLP